MNLGISISEAAAKKHTKCNLRKKIQQSENDQRKTPRNREMWTANRKSSFMQTEVKTPHRLHKAMKEIKRRLGLAFNLIFSFWSAADLFSPQISIKYSLALLSVQITNRQPKKCGTFLFHSSYKTLLFQKSMTYWDLLALASLMILYCRKVHPS